jgi:hypothetical protein
MTAHMDWCEADTGHDYGCATATELAKLRAFAQAVRDEIECIGHGGDEEGTEHADDCWHCGAADALEVPRG